MDRKKLLLLVAALGIAVLTAISARSLFASAAVPQAGLAEPASDGPRILVASRELPVGTIIAADSVGFKSWPKDMAADAYFVEGAADIGKLSGTVVRFAIPAGQPVSKGALVAPGDRGFLAAALGPGMRAITIAVSAQTGVAGFVFPGDHVDLMLTQTVEGEGQPLKATETIVENLRVLATDQSAQSQTAEGKTVVRTFGTVTLEVTPRIAEKIAVAQTIGTLGLSLRAISDSTSGLDRAIATGAVSLPENATPADEERLLAQATTRPVDDGHSFVTGGDVSRFQRHSMPAQNGPAPAPPPPPMAGPDDRPRVPLGPMVRVTRGKQVDIVSVKGF